MLHSWRRGGKEERKKKWQDGEELCQGIRVGQRGLQAASSQETASWQLHLGMNSEGSMVLNGECMTDGA